MASPGTEIVCEVPERSEHGRAVGVALGGESGDRIAQAIHGLDEEARVGLRQQVAPQGAELGVEVGEEGGI